MCHPLVPELSILECVVLHKQPRKRHKAAGMIQRSYRQWKQGQGITEVFILAKEEVTSRANPSSHRYSSLPAWLMQSRAGSCMHEPLIHTFLACWRLCNPWITFSTTPHSQVLRCQITTGEGTAFFFSVCQQNPSASSGQPIPTLTAWRDSQRLALARLPHGHLIIPTEYYAISKGIDADPQHPSGASINDTSL